MTRSIPGSRPRSCCTPKSSRASARRPHSSSCAPISARCGKYNDALEGGRIAGPNADEIVSILMQYTFIKDASVHRRITPPAIDPDGRLGLDSLRNDLIFFKEQRLIADPGMTVEKIIDTSFAEQAAKALGPY